MLYSRAIHVLYILVFGSHSDVFSCNIDLYYCAAQHAVQWADSQKNCDKRTFFHAGPPFLYIRESTFAASREGHHLLWEGDRLLPPPISPKKKNPNPSC